MLFCKLQFYFLFCFIEHILDFKNCQKLKKDILSNLIQNIYFMIKVIILALALTVLVSANYEYCEVFQEDTKLFFTHDERKNIDLSTYFKGYNLQYALPTESPFKLSGKASIRNPVVQIDSEQFKFEAQGIAGLQLLNVDRLITQKGKEAEEGIVVAYTGNTAVVARGIFTIGRTLPTINSYQTYKIQKAARCFKAVILNHQHDVAIDCQTQQNKNLMCLLQIGVQTPTCYEQTQSQTNSVRAAKSSKKITKVIKNSKADSYVISSETVQGIDTMFANLTTFSIYQVKDSKITLLNTIGADTFNQQNLGITDFTIDYSKRYAYMLSTVKKVDSYSSQLIVFYINSEISDYQKKPLKGQARSISLTNTGSFAKSIYIATRTQITEWDTYKFGIGKVFQIDPTDNEVTGIQSNYNYLVYTTTKANQYLYRKSSSPKQLMLFLASRLNLDIDSQIVLSEYVNLHLIFTLKGVILYDLNKGYLVMEQITDSGQIMVFARSGDNVCSARLTYQFLDNATKAYKKTTAHAFSEISQQKFTMKLDDYFGGSGLEYNITFNTSFNGDVEANINTITKYKFRQDVPSFDVDRTIAINQNSFYMAGTNDGSNKLYIFKCQLNDSQIVCENKVYGINDTITFMDGVKQTNGEVIFFFTQKNSKGVMKSIRAQSGAFGTYIIYPEYFDIDVLHVTERYAFLFFKKQNKIVFFNIQQQGSGTIDVNSFTDYQLLQLKGFYPRELFDDPNNPNILYIRTVTGIVCLSISKPDFLTRQYVSIVKIWEVFGDWQLSGYRAVIRGSQTAVIIQNNVITEFSVDEEQPLHTIDLRENLKLPLFYRFDLSTETISIMTEKNNVFIIRMNQAASDSIVGVVKNYNGRSWSTSGGWAIFPAFSQAYRMPSFSYLEIISNVKDQNFKVFINFRLQVKGFDDKNDVGLSQDYVVEIVNYQRNILPSPKDFTLKLPESSDGGQFQIPMDTYFGGPVSKYDINCDYCKTGKLKLVTPIRELPGKPKLNQINDMVLGTPNNFHQNLEFQDYQDFNESIVVVLDGNSLNILNTDNQLKHSVIFAPTQLTTCSKIGVAHIQDTTYTILVLCSSPQYQELLRFEYDQVSKPTFKKTYPIKDQRFYINNPNSIDMTAFTEGFSWIFIHDKDPQIKTSEGNVKIFLMSDSSAELGYTQVINGKTFGLTESTESINGFHIHNSVRVGFTIGKLGIGYSELNSPSAQQEHPLVNPKFLNLKKVVQIDDFTLNNTVYFTIKILGYDVGNNEMSVIVTSNNAAHMVMTLSNNDLGITFKSLDELYNPLAGLRPLYWLGITGDRLMVSYYNQSDYFLTNAIYHRAKFDNITMTNVFICLNTVAFPGNSFNLLVEDKVFQYQPSSAQKLALYDISQKFGVIANYSEPGNFHDMTIIASNQYNSAQVGISVSFDGGDNTGGIKWYAILLIIAGCVLVIGLAVGFYFKNKAKKDKQKVSLVTEGEQDEQV